MTLVGPLVSLRSKGRRRTALRAYRLLVLPILKTHINLAIVSNATYLVRRDNDLLDLMTISTDIARQFRSRYPFLRIMTAAGFITAIDSESAAR